MQIKLPVQRGVIHCIMHALCRCSTSLAEIPLFPQNNMAILEVHSFEWGRQWHNLQDFCSSPYLAHFPRVQYWMHQTRYKIATSWICYWFTFPDIHSAWYVDTSFDISAMSWLILSITLIEKEKLIFMFELLRVGLCSQELLLLLGFRQRSSHRSTLDGSFKKSPSPPNPNWDIGLPLKYIAYLRFICHPDTSSTCSHPLNTLL